jgi:hypothetical protein
VVKLTAILCCGVLAANGVAMRSAGLRGTQYQTTQAYERGRTLEFSNKPALRMSGC